MLESQFKREFKERIKTRLGGVDLDFIENKANARSTPDLIILGPIYWAALEFKTHKSARQQPNQEYHISRMNDKGYSRFVYPSNSDVILEELVQLFNPESSLEGDL